VLGLVSPVRLAKETIMQAMLILVIMTGMLGWLTVAVRGGVS
jgi:hypothetical protein